MRRRPGGEQLRVIKGGGRRSPPKKDMKYSPISLLLLAVALFLMAQVLMGWLWGSFNQRAGRVVVASEGSSYVTFSTGGLLSFEEELVFAPQSGFIQFKVKGGERVPVGKELALITTFPTEAMIGEAQAEEQNVGDYLQRFRHWLLDDRGAADPFSVDVLFPHNRETELKAERPGKVSFQIDGWEMFGPGSSFLYLDDEEFDEKKPDVNVLSCGDQVARFTPALRIINNYRWYYSAVLPPDPGNLIGDKDQVKIVFPFYPDRPVRAALVEVRQRDEGDVEITWRINQAAGDFYNHRWATAQIFYDSIDGVFIPDGTIVEQDGVEGVYVLEKGVVVFREITLLAQEDDRLLVEGVKPNERVIARPGRVKEGQRFLF